MRMFHNMLCKSQFSCSCLLAGVVPAACTGFVQHAEAAWYSLQGLSEVNTLQQVHRCLLANAQVSLIRCTCLLLSAGCCAAASCTGVCTMPTPPGTACKVCLIASTRKHACIRALACCASRIGQLQLSAGLQYCRMHRACTGCATWQHPGTGCKACLTASTHANRHAHLSTTLVYCPTVQLRLFAIYSGYCRMHRVCATCRHSQVQPAASV
jgi:hypothetical protein